jgi:hypothetical protein
MKHTAGSFLFAVALVACGGPSNNGDTGTQDAAPSDAASGETGTDASDVATGPCGHAGTPCCAGGSCRLAGLTCGADQLCHSMTNLYQPCNPGVDQCAMGTCIHAGIMPPGAATPGTFCSLTCTSVASCPMDPAGGGVTCIGPMGGPLDCYRQCDIGHTCPIGLTCAVYTDAMGVMMSFCVPNGM